MKSEIRSKTRQLMTDSDKPEGAAALPELASLLDKAVKSNILHKNTVARKKSRLAKMLNKKQASK
jgi:small subunit ribosomal protein S20